MTKQEISLYFGLVIDKLCPGAECNKAFIGLEEAEARKLKLWNDGRTMPTIAQIESCIGLVKLEEAAGEMRKERDKRILDADKLELPTVMQRFNLTTDQILVYKQALLDIPETHTTIEQLENPQWPDKLITQELL